MPKRIRAVFVGAHVVLEKPPGASIAELESMIRAARATEDQVDTIRRAIKVGFDGTGMTAVVGLEIVDAQAEAASLAAPAA